MQIARAEERMARADERMARAEERFVKLEQESSEHFARIERTLAALVRMLEQLPDAVREKTGLSAGFARQPNQGGPEHLAPARPA
jgi:hypothetical protein